MKYTNGMDISAIVKQLRNKKGQDIKVFPQVGDLLFDHDYKEICFVSLIRLSEDYIEISCWSKSKSADEPPYFPIYRFSFKDAKDRFTFVSSSFKL